MWGFTVKLGRYCNKISRPFALNMKGMDLITYQQPCAAYTIITHTGTNKNIKLLDGTKT